MSERDHTDTLIATVLRDVADREADGILAPPLTELQGRAADRRRRRRWVTVAGLAAAALVGAVVWANLPGQREAVVAPAEGPISSTFPVPTYEWDGGGGDQALVSGVMTFTDAGCPMLMFGESVTPLILPDATGVTYDNGVRGVIDAQGRLYGTEGQKIAYAGGWQEPMSGEFAASWDALCDDTPARDLVYVNEVAKFDPLAQVPEVQTGLPTVPTSREEAGWFMVPTYRMDPDAAREEALVEGTVEFTDGGCPYVEADGQRVGLVFPNAEGFDNPHAEEPRMVYVSFGDGASAVMAIEGEPISWGGGGAAADDERWTSVCAEPVDSVFIVQDSPFE